jgi:hypothetical protein
MLFFGVSILVQIFCAVHVIRNGRNSLWIMVIVFFSLIGCAAYFAVEILPTMRNNRHVRHMRAVATSKMDPERELRHALDQLSVADTVANQIAVADAYADLGRFHDALPLYREAIARTPGDDSITSTKLALALFETGQAAASLAELDKLPNGRNTADNDRKALLRARLFETLDRTDEAAAIYEDIVTRVPGEEARCRYAALLIGQGHPAKARLVLEEVEQRMKRLDRTQRAAEADMYDWAMAELSRLRG